MEIPSQDDVWDSILERDHLKLALLIRQGADINGMGKSTVSLLVKCIIYQSSTALDILLENGADVNEKLGVLDGTSVLGWVLHYKWDSYIERLLKAGADPNLKNDMGKSPMDFAVKRGSREAINLLVAYGGRI